MWLKTHGLGKGQKGMTERFRNVLHINNESGLNNLFYNNIFVCNKIEIFQGKVISPRCYIL